MSAYSTAVLADAPLGYWRMDDVTSTMVDSSGNGHNGTHSNTPTLSQPGGIPTDPTSTAVKYNGTNQYSSVAVDLSAFTRVAVEFWSNWATYNPTDQLAMEYTVLWQGNKGFVIDFTSSAGIFFGSGGSGADNFSDTFAHPSATVYHHFVFDMTRSGSSSLNLAYVDGVPQSLTTSTHNALTGTSFANSTLYFMSRAGSSLFCSPNSVIDEVAVYGGGLPSGSVLNHYNAAEGLPHPTTMNNYQPVTAGTGIWTPDRIR